MTTTFENAKVGDRVWAVWGGWFEITAVDKLVDYPIRFSKGRLVVGGSCTIDGRRYKNDTAQTVFWDEVKIIAPERPKPIPKDGTIVEVWGPTPQFKYIKVSAGSYNPDGHLVCYENGAISGNKYEQWRNWRVITPEDLV